MRKKQTARPEPISVMTAWKVIAGLPEGQVVLNDLVRRFAFTRTSTFVPGDPQRSMLNEGSRIVCVHIGRMIDGEDSDPTAQEEIEI